jgi:hypothetical protein
VPIFLVTKRSGLSQLFKASVKTSDVRSFIEARELLLAIAGINLGSEAALVAIDLSTTLDAARLIHFLRSSPGTSGIPILTIGTTADFNSLEPTARAALTEMLHVSATGNEIEAAITKHLKPERE